VAGVVVGAIIVARRGGGEGRRTAIPFGPFLALGALVAVFAGHPIVDAYVNRFLH
jgi:prepilin signal peptidase PulO-like enzyme (type II secretory pathway)